MRPGMSDGLWWLPDNPENRVPGTLKWRRSGAAELTLLGALANEHPFSQGAEQGLIHGSLANCPLGNIVSLFDCSPFSLSVSFPGLQRRGYLVDRMVFGDHVTT